jgi:hypothetical protein
VRTDLQHCEAFGFFCFLKYYFRSLGKTVQYNDTRDVNERATYCMDMICTMTTLHAQPAIHIAIPCCYTLRDTELSRDVLLCLLTHLVRDQAVQTISSPAARFTSRLRGELSADTTSSLVAPVPIDKSTSC